jgi:hypothetical protein
MAILKGTEMLRLPALPNTAWFFFASPPNYLSLRDDLPAQGALAAVFRSPRLPASLLVLGAASSAAAAVAASCTKIAQANAPNCPARFSRIGLSGARVAHLRIVLANERGHLSGRRGNRPVQPPGPTWSIGTGDLGG